jgi:hypothetical protein
MAFRPKNNANDKPLASLLKALCWVNQKINATGRLLPHFPYRIVF